MRVKRQSRPLRSESASFLELVRTAFSGDTEVNSRFALYSLGRKFQVRGEKIMDTMTYASVAALPENVANSTRRLLVPEVELTPLDLSYLGKSIRAEISRRTKCAGWRDC